MGSGHPILFFPGPRRRGAPARAVRTACGSSGRRGTDSPQIALAPAMAAPARSCHLNPSRNSRQYLIRIRIIAISISLRYVLLMIRSFKGKFAEPILQDRMTPKGFPANLAKIARRRLIMVDSAAFLEGLNSPPGNRRERLKGVLAGKHSIRIN